MTSLEVLNTVTYRVHHRIAASWRQNNVFLMGDAAHLITPMWALGLNTGVLDTLNLPWRLAWVIRGWSEGALLDGFEREQQPLAAHGSGEMAESARKRMGRENEKTNAMSGSDWANAMTRSLLGVRVDPDGIGDWSLVKTERTNLRVGDRVADSVIFDGQGRRINIHDLCDDSFVALYFTDVRRGPRVPPDNLPGLRSYVISRWDAPLDSALRDRALLDVGNRFRDAMGLTEDSVVLLRPDDHVAAIVPMASTDIHGIYARVAHLKTKAS